ncbi:MAG TPA: DUF2267 domain-containing protein [Acidimicrobiales bacterium]|nr:DUF2267 domain-containing protein [Acidimicrobiales bacterium]
MRGAAVRWGDRANRRLNRWTTRWPGVSYRIRGRRPDPNVSANVLADRIRSALGPLESKLDVPRVHVMVHDRVATLHGDVVTAEQAARIEEAVLSVSGVADVRSYLHVGLARGESRPSDGARVEVPSAAFRRLEADAVNAGADPDKARRVIRAVLGALVERLPTEERRHFLNHLPADVRAMAAGPWFMGADVATIRTVDELVSSVAGAVGGIAPGREEHVIESIFAGLKDLVPEESADVAAVLPADLSAFWKAAVEG